MSRTTTFRYSFIALVFTSLVLLSGCAGLFEKEPLPQPVLKPQSSTSPLQELERAFARNDYSRVEVLGQKLVDDASLSNMEKTRAATLFAVAATRAGHPNVALGALDTWRTITPGADQGRDWQQVWCEAMGLMPSREARTKANEVYQDTSRKPVVRGIAAIFFAVRQWSDGDVGQTMAALESVYKAAPDTATKAAYEVRLASLLDMAPGHAIGLIADSVNDANQNNFPYNIILIDQLRRQSQNPQLRGPAQAALDALAKTVNLADPSLLKGPPPPVQFSASVSSGPTTATSGKGGPIVLVLPRSGQYATVTDQIVNGAEIAAAAMGTTVTVIDTDQTGWVAQLQGLPPEVTVVGGPLRPNDYSAMKQQGIMRQRAVLAFLPSLAGEDEGAVAWRFFSSPSDQIDTLVGFASGVGVRAFASVYPDDTYGRRMHQLFESRVQATGGKVESAMYPAGQHENWMKTAGAIVAKGVFQAIFLPDTWRSADSIVNSLSQHVQGDRIILGTSLWEQALGKITSLSNADKFALAVFPGSWNNQNPSAAASRLRSSLSSQGRGEADFWAGLGYDFARCASALSLQPGWTPSQVNATLANMSLDWSIAPLHWDGHGKASQSLFLFTPRDGVGYAPIDRNAFYGVVGQ